MEFLTLPLKYKGESVVEKLFGLFLPTGSKTIRSLWTSAIISISLVSSSMRANVNKRRNERKIRISDRTY